MLPRRVTGATTRRLAQALRAGPLRQGDLRLRHLHCLRYVANAAVTWPLIISALCLQLATLLLALLRMRRLHPRIRMRRGRRLLLLLLLQRWVRQRLWSLGLVLLGRRRREASRAERRRLR